MTNGDEKLLAEEFETNRAHLRAVAYRMLGSTTDAEDAVQEAWLRLVRHDPEGIEDLGRWLTTVVARICLDMLRSRRLRPQESLESSVVEPMVTARAGGNPEYEALIADSIGLSLLVVLEMLSPPERVAFVLRDVFDLPFAEIALIVGRSPAAARQLASRARRRVQGARTPKADLQSQRRVVDAFLAASRTGNFRALLALLDPEVVLRGDDEVVRMGGDREARGVTAVAQTFSGRARAAQPALIDGAVGLAWAPGGKPRVVFDLKIAGGRITAIELIADEARIGRMDLQLLEE